jgi:GH24 family phage-related lysozyme (muramidase)
MTKALFDAIRQIKGAPLTQSDVDAVNAALAQDDVEAAPLSPGVLTPSPAAVALMHEFEGCRLQAYPDPGSADGHPWTIGFGSTGPGIAKGVVWTQKQADDRFVADLAKFAAKVRDVLAGAKTTQAQFDAMVSLSYNIGVGAFSKSTVLRKHRAGDYPGAQAAFALWNKNDGKVMAGLTRRRAAEAALYGSAS